MPAGADIDPLIRRRVEEELARIEREQNVRALLAVESGIRAWGFPSPDSDYDARFLYVRPREAYLSIAAPRDVIETPLTDVLDLAGWDLRKALQLLCKSNAVLIEWLTSPIRYLSCDDGPSQLLGLARATCHLPAIEYHYDRMARRSVAEIGTTADVSFKTYFYALRPALAVLWIRQRGDLPPMDLRSLMAGVDVPEETRGVVDGLVRRKAVAVERERTARVPAADRLVADVLRIEAPRPDKLPDRERAVAAADALFFSLLRPAAP